jgi:uncharacterized metal-binding protein
MRGTIHESISFLILFLFSLSIFNYNVYYLRSPLYYVPLFQFIAGWLMQTLYINNDLDAKYSRSKNRIGYFKYLFIFTKHRKTLHNPYFWIAVGEGIWILGYFWFGAGLVGSAMVHLVLDWISDRQNHKRKKLVENII